LIQLNGFFSVDINKQNCPKIVSAPSLCAMKHLAVLHHGCTFLMRNTTSLFPLPWFSHARSACPRDKGKKGTAPTHGLRNAFASSSCGKSCVLFHRKMVSLYDEYNEYHSYIMCPDRGSCLLLTLSGTIQWR